MRSHAENLLKDRAFFRDVMGQADSADNVFDRKTYECDTGIYERREIRRQPPARVAP